MGKPKAPEPPDPKATAGAQTATNIGTAIANSTLANVSQQTPYGSLTYAQTGTTKWTDPLNGNAYDLPSYTATTRLSPEQQAVLDQNNQASLNLSKLASSQSGKLNTLLGSTLDLSAAPAAGQAAYQRFGAAPTLRTSYEDNFSADRQRTEDALMARLEPKLQQDRAALETRLTNQGLAPGSTAWNRAMDETNRAATDARFGAVLNAGQEQSRLAGLAREQATFGNAAAQQNFQNTQGVTQSNNALEGQQAQEQNARRTQWLNEQYAARNQPINEIGALLSGSQVRNPQFANVSGQTIPNVDYAGLVNENYNQRLGIYNQQQAASGQLLGGIAGGILGLMRSDRRAKTEIKKVGGLYEYRYKGEGKDTPKRIGVMAQEIEKVRPEAVSRGADGMRQVDYGLLFSAGTGTRRKNEFFGQ